MLKVYALSVFATLALVIALLPTAASAKNSNPAILPPNSSGYGATYGEWSARWSQWALSQPANGNPLLASGAVNCAQGQNGQVWFLGGTWAGGDVVRSCTIPTGTPLFFPVVNAVWVNLPSDPPFDEETVRGILGGFIDTFSNGEGEISAEIDGAEVMGLSAYRAQSPIFTASLPEDNLFDPPFSGSDVMAGDYEESVADGIYLMLAPLPPGEHTIHFSANIPSGPFALDVTYHLTVVPKGKYQPSATDALRNGDASTEYTGTAIGVPSQLFLPFTMGNRVEPPSVVPGPCGPGLLPPFARVATVICG